jgi:hypothetical protein
LNAPLLILLGAVVVLLGLLVAGLIVTAGRCDDALDQAMLEIRQQAERRKRLHVVPDDEPDEWFPKQGWIG